ncbi:parallel beta-helix repeat protein [Janthinobacterium sp. CG_23.3]|uniref:right-handed parallel beta-helix repeat-containing protein n=1 Tax=Janthinobacterium sp. CG_23.3 TaxID=3349634 RepID=UPI0038D4B095
MKISPSAATSILLSMAFCAVSSPALAINYYVSSTGSDSNNGNSEAVTGPAKGPFATLNALTRLKLENGDNIFLACGERFQGPLNLSLQSTRAGALTITRSGNCIENPRPVITGKIQLAALSGVGQVSDLTLPVGEIVQVFAGNIPVARARFPKSTYLIYPDTAIASDIRIPSNSAIDGKDLLKAVAHARTEEWFLEERTIIDVNLALDKKLEHPLNHKAGVYFTGKEWMIGTDYNWAYDKSIHKLSINKHTNYPVSVVYQGDLLLISGRGSVVVDSVEFDGAGADGLKINIQDGPVKVNNIMSRHSVGNGISVWGAITAEVTNSKIEDTGLDAIFFAESLNATVKKNVILNAGLYQGPNPNLAAINAHRTVSATVTENFIDRAGYIGIRVSGAAKVQGNILQSTCLNLSDCGAIYTWRRNIDDLRPLTEISGNVIKNVDGDISVKRWLNDWFVGIYLDDYTKNVSVDGNIIINAGQSIYLHNAENNFVKNNYSVASRVYNLIMKNDKNAIQQGDLYAGGDVVYIGMSSPYTFRTQNIFESNTTVKTGWSVQNFGESLQTNETLRFLTGFKKADGTFPVTPLPVNCVNKTIGSPEGGLKIVSAAVYACL